MCRRVNVEGVCLSVWWGFCYCDHKGIKIKQKKEKNRKEGKEKLLGQVVQGLKSLTSPV